MEFKENYKNKWKIIFLERFASKSICNINHSVTSDEVFGVPLWSSCGLDEISREIQVPSMGVLFNYVANHSNEAHKNIP